VNSSLYQRGLAFDGENGLDSFKAKAANGTLPTVSWVFPPGALQEHPPNTPKDASWFMNQVIDSAIHGPNYNETIILLNYDGKSNVFRVLENEFQKANNIHRGWWLG
jgi:phospholipase C